MWTRKKPSRPRRNDLLPLLRIETCSIDALKSHARKLRKSDLASARSRNSHFDQHARIQRAAIDWQRQCRGRRGIEAGGRKIAWPVIGAVHSRRSPRRDRRPARPPRVGSCGPSSFSSLTAVNDRRFAALIAHFVCVAAFSVSARQLQSNC